MLAEAQAAAGLSGPSVQAPNDYPLNVRDEGRLIEVSNENVQADVGNHEVRQYVYMLEPSAELAFQSSFLPLQSSSLGQMLGCDRDDAEEEDEDDEEDEDEEGAGSGQAPPCMLSPKILISS